MVATITTICKLTENKVKMKNKMHECFPALTIGEGKKGRGVMLKC